MCVMVFYMGSVWFHTYGTNYFVLFYCIKVPKDGDCLYSSVKSSLQIAEDSQMDKMYQAQICQAPGSGTLSGV